MLSGDPTALQILGDFDNTTDVVENIGDVGFNHPNPFGSSGNTWIPIPDGIDDYVYTDLHNSKVIAVSGADGSSFWERSNAGGESFGWALEVIGDIDDDGYDDIAVGVPGHKLSGLHSGRVDIISGDDGNLLMSVDPKDYVGNVGTEGPFYSDFHDGTDTSDFEYQLFGFSLEWVTQGINSYIAIGDPLAGSPFDSTVTVNLGDTDNDGEDEYSETTVLDIAEHGAVGISTRQNQPHLLARHGVTLL